LLRRRRRRVATSRTQIFPAPSPPPTPMATRFLRDNGKAAAACLD